MMSTQASHTLGGTIGAAGVLATLGFLAFGSGAAALSALAGAVLAVANFYVWSWLVARMLNKQVHNQIHDQAGEGPKLGLLIVMKLVLGFGLVAGLLALRWVEAVPFAAGLGSLVIGLVAGGAWLSTAVEMPGVPQEEA